MRRIFLDVGAHEGQTLDVAVRPVHAFDRIYAFEPMPAQYATLLQRYGTLRTVTLLNFGLADRTSMRSVYGTNDAMEASLYPAKVDVDERTVTMCAFIEAASFFREHIPKDATVIVKLNCEGAEVEILRSLMASGEIWKCTNVMVDFDVRKIPGMEDQERKVMRHLRARGFDRCIEREYVMLGETHAERITHWLGTCR